VVFGAFEAVVDAAVDFVVEQAVFVVEVGLELFVLGVEALSQLLLQLLVVLLFVYGVECAAVLEFVLVGFLSGLFFTPLAVFENIHRLIYQLTAIKFCWHPNKGFRAE
jgi:hypothetical protein